MLYYIEKLLELIDEYANDAIAFRVLESLFLDEDIDYALFIKVAKPKTLEIIREIIQSLEK